MIKQLWILILTALFGTISLAVCAGTNEFNLASSNDSLNIMECVKPEINSYWNGETSQTGDEFVVIYSVQGLWADIESRFPPDVVRVIREASAQTLSKDKLTLAARDMEQISSDFYGALQTGLARLARLPDDACEIQVQRLIKVFNKRYHFSLQGGHMDQWYLENHINELNVRNDQFLALFSKGSEIKGGCKVVYDDGSKRVEVCQ
jgi:hypothetical protein